MARKAATPILPSPRAPFYWEEMPDREWGHWWRARTDDAVFVEVSYRRSGWRVIVGCYRRAPRCVRIGDMMDAVDFALRWLGVHGERAIAEARFCAAMPYTVRSPFDPNDPYISRRPDGLLGFRHP